MVGLIADCAGRSQDTTTGAIAQCQPGEPAPAKQAGIRSGDLIVSVAGTDTPTESDVIKATRGLVGPTPFVVERDGQRQTVTVDIARVQRLPMGAELGKQARLETVGAVGMGFAGNIEYSPLAAFPATADMTGQMFANTRVGS